ncbi:putative RNA polymerase II subunit B1 CTD phosphatase rtr1 [Pseudocercospora fuligena]|uniref:RNA polymerase II subunit B1 CTD phosphatase RPAP2 homolog n=1 Tax=Pseudocercospora fuligena TaxID=685502 RepID=A0A8H6VJS1_9PEZI|nr:putative RNA polymerase II subunit B1 CTD phosphatase rtr1 [Pseudocercospora fuligena]
MASSSTLPVKSILKQPKRKTPVVTDEQKAQAEKDRKNLNIALAHAYRIQHQKDAEAQILNSITFLIDLPATSAFTSKEAITFVQHVRIFQPSDFDSLVEERRIDGRCGYTLCLSKPRIQTMGTSAEWKLKKGMSDYCSNECAKKNLFIKTQLSEVPAWERAPEQQPEIQLHADDRPPDDDTAVRRANRAARVDAWRQKVADEKDLAAERGETTTSFRPKQVMADGIVEKQPSKKPPRAPDADEIERDAGAIEGFRPRRLGKNPWSTTNAGTDEEDEDEEEYVDD